jgi:hypothetical protein
LYTLRRVIKKGGFYMVRAMTIALSSLDYSITQPIIP